MKALTSSELLNIIGGRLTKEERDFLLSLTSKERTKEQTEALLKDFAEEITAQSTKHVQKLKEIIKKRN
jgi:hypothetical protein